MNDFIKTYLAKLTSIYPSTKTLLQPSASPNALGLFEQSLSLLLSDQVLPFPKEQYQQVEKTVESIYHFSRSQKQLDTLNSTLPLFEKKILNLNVPNDSLLMAYDFHWDSSLNQLSLIEVNTNASNFLTTELLYSLSPDPSPWPNALNSLKDSFYNEWGQIHSPRAAIIDDRPPEQRLYVEFLMYKDLLSSWGWPTEIHDVNKVPLNDLDFIYNRHTDFLFEEPASASLLEYYLTNKIRFSPHPREYLLTSSKDRLIDFYNNSLSSTLTPIHLMTKDTDLEQLWSNRKSLFFKPRKLYGAKAVYRGESVTRKIFEQIVQEDYVAQEFRRAGQWNSWKFDLRFFVYKNVIQLGCARLYQGQVTNFRTPGGGLARLTLV